LKQFKLTLDQAERICGCKTWTC